MNHRKSHRFIATASTAAVSLTMLVAAGALAQEVTSADAVTAVAAPADAAPSPTATQLQARIIDVSGKARWRSSPDGEWKDAAVNDDLSPGAEVRTGMRSRVTLRFRNATVLVDSSTNFSIPTIEQEGDVLRTIAAVRSGRADFKVDKVGLQNDFKVVTPSTTLAVRGTSFSTITGPLKGVEIVGARENAMRAIEVRYAALNQTVEMSGGAEAKSTSETPNPTEHALGTTFNVPQAGMIASKEEAQQGALAGTSAPQTQRQGTTADAGISEAKQDLEAAARGEGGTGTMSLIAHITRVAGARSGTEFRRNSMLPHLQQALAAAGTARDRFAAAEAAEGAYRMAKANATQAIAAAMAAATDARSGVDQSLDAAAAVRERGDSAFRLFAQGGPDANDADILALVAQARGQLELSADALVPVQGQLDTANDRLGVASAEAGKLVPFADAFYAAYDALEAAARIFSQPETPITRMQDIAPLVQEAHQLVLEIAARRSHPLVSSEVVQSALALADALALLTQARSERDEALRVAGQAALLAQRVARDAMLSEIQQASNLAAETQQLLAQAELASTEAGQHLSNLDLAIEGMLVARSGEEEARFAKVAAEEFAEFSQSNSLYATEQAAIGANARALVEARNLDVLRELNVALDALAQTRLYGDATTEYAQAVYEALGQSVPDDAAASLAASNARAQAGLAQVQSGIATASSLIADTAANQASAAVGATSFSNSETNWSSSLALAQQDLSDADLAATAADTAAGHSAAGAGVATTAGTAYGGQDALAAVQAAEQLAELAADYARDADAAVAAAEIAYQGAMAAGRSAAQVTVWAAARTLAAQSRIHANQAMAAALDAREVAGVAMAEALAATEALGGPRTATSTLAAGNAAQSAGAAGDRGAAEVLAFVQRHMALLQSSVNEVNAAMQVLGSTLAATEVSQQSASGVAERVAGVAQALTQFRAVADSPGGASDQQVSALLGALLEARNQSLALALAAGTGAADAGASVAAHASGLAGEGALSAQDRAAAINAILQQAAATLGAGTNDPRLQLIAALSTSASGWAAQAGTNAQAAAGSAGDAAQSQAAARAQLLALGIQPTWGIGDASLYGSDLAAAAAAASQAADHANQASFGASALVSIDGAARATAASVDASERSALAFALAGDKAEQAASLWRAAAGEIGSPGAARGQAIAQIAQIRGEVSQIRGQSSSAVNAASGGLDGLVSMLGAESVDVDAAEQVLAGIGVATSQLREAADHAVVVGGGATDAANGYVNVLTAMGIGAAQAAELLEQVNLEHVPAAEAWRAIAAANLEALAPYVAQVLGAAAAGEDVSIDQLAVAASWMQAQATEELARANAARAALLASDGALADANSALADYNSAVAASAGDVIAAAEAAVADANAFLQEVLGLQREQAVATRAVDAAGASVDAQQVLAAVHARAAQVSQTVLQASGAVTQYQSAVQAMSSAVGTAQAARDQAIGRLVDLEGHRGSGDAKLGSLRASLAAGDRSTAAGDVSALSGLASLASQSATEADALRSQALGALSSIGVLESAAVAAQAGVQGAQSDVGAHQMALNGFGEQADAAQLRAQQSTSGLSDLVVAAGTDRAEALGGHALALSAQALLRASNALEQIASSQSDLNQLQLALSGASVNQHGALAAEALAITEWAQDLGFGSTSLPAEAAAQVAAMHGVAQGTLGAYDARVTAFASRQNAELARDRADTAEYVSATALDVHNSAMVQVNVEHQEASTRRIDAAGEFVLASVFRVQAGYWLQQTLNYVEASNPELAAMAAGSSNDGAVGAEQAASRAGIAASLAEAAGSRALWWAQESADAFAIANGAAQDAEAERDIAVLRAGDTLAAGGAATGFAAAAEQFAAIAATAAASDASAFARQMRDQAVAQIVLAQSARDGAQAAAANARTHANKIVFGAVAAKADQTVALATQARDFANGALAQSVEARTDANAAIAAATSAAGGTQ